MESVQNIAGIAGTLGRNPFAIRASTTPTRSSIEDPTRESRPLVAPPILVLGQENPRPSGFVLKPSALSVQASNLRIYNTPTSINNGKQKEQSDEDEKRVEHQPDSSNNAEKRNHNSDCVRNKREASKNSPNTASMDSKRVDDTTTTTTEVILNHNLNNRVIPDGGFVFGENIRDRVSNADNVELSTEPQLMPTDLSFAAAASGPKSQSTNRQESSGQPSQAEKRSLNETAEEYEQRMENAAKKSKFEEVEVVTGEEDERNVVQINCKMFIFESNQYHERGRGILRLNDKQNPEDGSLQSRVVMRTQGILRVVLNTKVWAGMSVEYANDRSLRMTGQGPDGSSAVYLIQCNQRDAEQLFNALEWRVQALKNLQTRDEERSRDDTNKQTIDVKTSDETKITAKESTNPEHTTSSNEETAIDPEVGESSSENPTG